MANQVVEMLYYSQMYPVLVSIGNFPISSFGLMLALGIFLGGFTVWRIARGYDLDAEKVLDMVFLTVGFGFIASRTLFIILNLSIFDSWTKIFFINRYPGFSLWGGFVGGILALNWLAKKFKVPVLQAGDFAMVGFLIAAAFAEIGCLLGGCGVGLETNLFFGVTQVGVIGKRIPIQLFEAAAFLFFFFVFWKKILKFYVQGDLFARGIIVTALIKLVATLFKSQNTVLKVAGFWLNFDLIFAVLVLLFGIGFYYQVNKKTPFGDLASILRFFLSRKTQSQVVTKISRGWYNHWVNFRIGVTRTRKRIFKLLNIRSNPEKF